LYTDQGLKALNNENLMPNISPEIGKTCVRIFNVFAFQSIFYLKMRNVIQLFFVHYKFVLFKLAVLFGYTWDGRFMERKILGKNFQLSLIFVFQFISNFIKKIQFKFPVIPQYPISNIQLPKSIHASYIISILFN
jgi:hypothetical protein